MNKGYQTPYKRRKIGKTDYKKRLRLLKSKKPRFVVRKSTKHIRVQVVEYNPKGDKMLASAFSKELQKLGWKYSTKNMSAAYLTGLLCGLRALKAECKGAVLDIGLNKPIAGSKLYSALKGALDAGLNIPFEESALPKEERISGAHIVEFSKKKGGPKNVDKLSSDFESMKKKILSTPSVKTKRSKK